MAGDLEKGNHVTWNSHGSTVQRGEQKGKTNHKNTCFFRKA